MMDLAQFCRHLPKVELHAHLNGSLSSATLEKLKKLADRNDECDGWPMCSSDLDSCFKLFAVAHNLTVTQECVKLATLCTIEEFAADSVIYLELRSTPRAESGMTKTQYLQAIVDSVHEAKTTVPDIIVNILVSINRRHSVESAKENIDLAIDFHRQYPNIITGVDFSGDPSKGRFSDFADLLIRARASDLRVTVHIAEIQNDQEVREILNLNPDRLGHGTYLSDENSKLLLLKKIPLEICITSNLKCGTVKSVDEHHFRYLNGEGHRLILCTDDKGVFDTTLSHEYKIASESFALTRDYLYHMSLNAVDCIFADDSVKFGLKHKLLTWREQHGEYFN